MPANPEKPGSGKLPGPAQSDLLALYGITSVPSTSYEWGGYRYTNAHDAIAAAKRDASS